MVSSYYVEQMLTLVSTGINSSASMGILVESINDQEIHATQISNNLAVRKRG